METLILVGKWVAGIIATLITASFVGLVTWILSKLNNTYSKQQTHEYVDMRLLPLQNSLDNHKNATQDLTEATKQLSETIQHLNIKLAIVETKIEGNK